MTGLQQGRSYLAGSDGVMPADTAHDLAGRFRRLGLRGGVEASANGDHVPACGVSALHQKPSRFPSHDFFFGLAGLGFALGATCGVGGVFSIRRSTSASAGFGLSLLIGRVCHG